MIYSRLIFDRLSETTKPHLEKICSLATQVAGIAGMLWQHLKAGFCVSSIF